MFSFVSAAANLQGRRLMMSSSSSLSKTATMTTTRMTRNFHRSATALSKQNRFTLGNPRRVRLHLSDSSRNASAGAKVGGGKTSSGGYPMYLKVGAGVTVVGSVALYFHYQNFAPMTNRRRWIASTPEFEKEMGDENYQQLLQQFTGKVLPKHHPATIAIERVGGRIFKAAGEFAKEYELEYFDTKNVTFTVVETDQANAFVLPGNHVFCKFVVHEKMSILLMCDNADNFSFSRL